MSKNKIDSGTVQSNPQSGFEKDVGSSRHLIHLYHGILCLIFLVHPLAPTVLTYLDVEFIPTVWHRDGEVEIKPGLPEDFLQRPWSNTDMTRSAARRPTNSPWQGKSGKYGNGSTTKESRK
ncbi:hypothetical protein FOMA001_g19447 [Fusarium oxysporum f. sp. matthiolae]|nr:hypothetical protein FOMA001_g19447 [Fusarium oxysporum f. sp. matthiolae]